jgi:hypothetical protein
MEKGLVQTQKRNQKRAQQLGNRGPTRKRMLLFHSRSCRLSRAIAKFFLEAVRDTRIQKVRDKSYLESMGKSYLETVEQIILWNLRIKSYLEIVGQFILGICGTAVTTSKPSTARLDLTNNSNTWHLNPRCHLSMLSSKSTS